MTDDPDRTQKERAPHPSRDLWAAQSFTFRRMSWTNIWVLIIAMVIAMLILAMFMGGRG
jgi:hypothetical protein